MATNIPAPTTLLRWGSRLAPELLQFRLPRGGASFALTFDDGPHPAHTPRILELLGRSRVRATFFLQGELCERHPDLVRRVIAEGHRVGSHGWDHRSARRLDAAEALLQATRCHELLCQLAGQPLPRLHRPPYGEMTLGALIRLAREGFRLVFWSYDSRDSFVTDAASLQERFETQPPKPGDIILLHEDYPLTVSALPSLLEALQVRATLGDVDGQSCETHEAGHAPACP